MKHNLKCTVLLLVTVLAAIEVSGKKKETIPPDPRFASIENISVLPLVDARAGKKSGVKLDKLQDSVIHSLRKKNYSASAAMTPGDAGEIAIEDIQGASPNYIKKLGPSTERWVMVIFLDDVASKTTFGSTGNAELSGFLFDKDHGSLVWSGKGVGQAGQGGLMGMAMKPMMKEEALSAAVLDLLAGIPKLPKGGK